MKLYYELEVDLTGLADNFKVRDESNQGFGLSNLYGRRRLEEEWVLGDKSRVLL